MFKIKKLESCRSVFSEHKILTLSGIYIYKVILLVVNHLEYNSLLENCHTYDTRHSKDYYRKRCNLNATEKSPYIYGCILFNKLPDDLKSLREQPVKFKKLLKQYLTDKAFYTV